jgi:hypothetical protein
MSDLNEFKPQDCLAEIRIEAYAENPITFNMQTPLNSSTDETQCLIGEFSKPQALRKIMILY